MSQFDDEIHQLTPEQTAETDAWRRAVEEDEGYDVPREPIRLDARQWEAIREATIATVERFGIPFLRAHKLTEAILAEVKKL